MFKLILTTILVAPAALFAATEFQCFTDAPGKKTHVTAQFNFNEPATAGKVYTRAQVEIAGSTVEKYCAVFEVEKNFKRIGFLQTYRSQLSNGTVLSLTEESYVNEGPGEFRYGTMKLSASAVAIPLSCVKKTL